MPSDLRSHRCRSARESRWTPLRTWFLGNTLLAGLFALGWLLLRSGSRPSRLAYPCQQAAISTATLAFGAPLVAALLALRNGLREGLGSPRRALAAATGLLVTLAAWGLISGLEATPSPPGPVLPPTDDYRAQVFHLADCPPDPQGDRFPCLDAMLELMGSQGLKFYESPVVTPLSGPSGIIDDHDVVIVKINYQWSQRGGTNTDVLRGLIRAIVDHPDGFDGEVVVAENVQDVAGGTQGFDRPDNNAQDITLSPYDVVTWFQGLGHDVSIYDWNAIRKVEVDEYSSGDPTDGYVLYDHDPLLNGRLSYPKFRTASGTRVSLKHGIWNGSSYNRSRLKLINVPVLKSHGASYGATACLKNNMGVVTTWFNTRAHNAVRQGMMGDLLGEIRPADLNVLDAIWVNGHPDGGPWTTYVEATRRDELVVSTDAVAADIWAVKNILIPAFLDNGYSPPWPYPSADPDDPTSDFRVYLDNSLYWLLDAGFDATNDFDRIDVYSVTLPFFTDDFESGDTSAWSVTVP